VTPWFKLAADMARLSVEAQCVIALRMIRLAEGGSRARREADRMILEKLLAMGEAGFGMFLPYRSHRGRAITRNTLRIYGKRVRGNRRRLGKG
jgi:hypothetical protein